jgi:hypothetical protein
MALFNNSMLFHQVFLKGIYSLRFYFSGQALLIMPFIMFTHKRKAWIFAAALFRLKHILFVIEDHMVRNILVVDPDPC